jgi:competence ComEA-like helix-hairpin-helix protein
MTFYTRPQLVVLVTVVAVAGLGIAVSHWRRLNPELVERLEGFDGPAETSQAVTRDVATAIPPSPGESTKALDVNRASALDLARLPGVGAALAARIVSVRERDGPFATVEDLRRVRGLRGATLDRFRARVTAVPLDPTGTTISDTSVP